MDPIIEAADISRLRQTLAEPGYISATRLEQPVLHATSHAMPPEAGRHSQVCRLEFLSVPLFRIVR